MITRPNTNFDGPSHVYSLDGEKLLGVSTVAKIGQAESIWGVASAWGFRIGYEGAHAVLRDRGTHVPESPDVLRAELKKRGLTPWQVRDKAQDRGTWTHDLLERLGQEGEVPTAELLAGVSDEYAGHARAVIAWFLKYRPEFVALEVQVTSEKHGFAGRYDVRCLISGETLIANGIEILGSFLVDSQTTYLCLVDLKTSKGIYPTSHHAQLAGYEIASVEMGFPPTDAQFVLNTHPDGTFAFEPSWAIPEDFLAYLAALKAIRRIEANDPERKRQEAREQAVLANLPGYSRDLALSVPELAGMDGRGVGILLGGLRKRGLVSQERGVWSVVPAG